MAAESVVTPEAERDIAEAYAWYEDRRAGLGEEFLGAVDAWIRATCRTPEMYAVVYEEYRRGLLRRFPYAVFLLRVLRKHGDHLQRISRFSRSREMACTPHVMRARAVPHSHSPLRPSLSPRQQEGWIPAFARNDEGDRG